MPIQQIPTPSADELRSILEYNPDTGLFFWRERTTQSHGSLREINRWNSRYAGKLAGSVASSNGYVGIAIRRQSFMAHRLAWVMHYGESPKRFIDHINRIRTDNRIINLRDVSHGENQMNAGVSKRNTSGVVGVSWDKESSRWRAFTRQDGKMVGLGRFKTIEAAAAVRRAAEVGLGIPAMHLKLPNKEWEI